MRGGALDPPTHADINIVYISFRKGFCTVYRVYNRYGLNLAFFHDKLRWGTAGLWPIPTPTMYVCGL